MTRIIFVPGIALTLISAVALARAPQEAKTGETDAPKCVVMDKSIKWDVYTFYDGRPVYFCCKRCRGKFEADPEKFKDAALAQQKQIKPVAVQVTCPASGEPIDKEVHVDTPDHGRVYFCCPRCKAAWEKDSSKLRAKLRDAYTFQTRCPIMDEPIDPAVSTEHDDRTVYFCCKRCIPKFEADPAAYLKKIDEQIAANKAEMKKRHGEEG